MLFWLIGDLGGTTVATPALVTLAVALAAVARVRAGPQRAVARRGRRPPRWASRSRARPLVLCAVAALAHRGGGHHGRQRRLRRARGSARASPRHRQRSAPAAAGERALPAERCSLLADTLARTIAAPIQLPGRRDHRARRRAGAARAPGAGPLVTADAPACRAAASRLSVAGRTLAHRPRFRRARRRVLGRHRAERRRQDHARHRARRPARARRRARSRTTARRSPHSGRASARGSAASCRRTASTTFPRPCSRPRSSDAIRISRAGSGNRPRTSIARAPRLRPSGSPASTRAMRERSPAASGGAWRSRRSSRRIPALLAAGRALVASRSRPAGGRARHA